MHSPRYTKSYVFRNARRDSFPFGATEVTTSAGIVSDFCIKIYVTYYSFINRLLLGAFMIHAYKEGRIILSGCLIVNDQKEVLLLYRDDHQHYETPGGKVRLAECSNPKNPTIEDLAKTAERETYEELGKDIKLAGLSYLGKVEFVIPDGRTAIANKFLTKIVSGTPKLNEPDKFSKMDYLLVKKLKEYPISPDLQLFLDELKSRLAGKR